ncbi:Protein phosphatase 2C [Spironucleus salmonicida]|uniref:Protein phosphatase 2C n=1 Tax=Spironucleus salmonicida TaxID=348837 RepID=V6LNR1_9EUKA|nr:Protein phosphatase 2C [Spironucleus salmonicida]|eukprot:EST45356.1 Protein phosphatase 2C [Spironucleus salmonicida]
MYQEESNESESKSYEDYYEPRLFYPDYDSKYEIYPTDLSDQSEDQPMPIFSPAEAEHICGRRDHAEDRTLIHSEEGFQLLCVMDGHGGSEASQYVKDHYVETLSKKLKAEPKIKTKTAVVNALAKMEDVVCNSWESTGTTFAGVIIRNGKALIHHIGDSRVIVGLKDGRVVESIDHKPNLHCERYRIHVENRRKIDYSNKLFRLQTGLAMSRAIGDKDFKRISNDAIATPDFQSVPSEDVKWIFAASDGVIDQLTTDQIVNIINCLCHKPHKVMKTNSHLENLAIEVFNGKENISEFNNVFGKKDAGYQIVKQDGSFSKKIVDTLIAISYRSWGQDNIGALFQVIPNFEDYPPRNFNTLLVENIDSPLNTFSKTFPYPRIFAKNLGNFLVYDNSTYTQLLIRHKFPDAKITELELDRDQIVNLTFQSYQQMSLYTKFPGHVYVTQSRTMGEGKFYSEIRGYNEQNIKEIVRCSNSDDFTLKFPCYRINDIQDIDEIYMKFAEMPIPPLIYFENCREYTSFENDKQKEDFDISLRIVESMRPKQYLSQQVQQQPKIHSTKRYKKTVSYLVIHKKLSIHKK